MKKLSFIPKRDTITICLPPDWVGKKITCFLTSVAENSTQEKEILMAAERPAKYNAKTKTKSKTNKAKSTQKNKAKKAESNPVKSKEKNSAKNVKGDTKRSETETTNEVQPQSNA